MDESDIFPSDIDAEDNLVPAKKQGSELVNNDNVASHRLMQFSGRKRVVLFHFTTSIETGALLWWGGLGVSMTQRAMPVAVSTPGRSYHTGRINGGKSVS